MRHGGAGAFAYQPIVSTFQGSITAEVTAAISPLVREWECMTLDELGKDKRAAILAIATRHGVARVRVFGSFARGEAGEDSDLDLLIEAGPRTPPWFPGGLLVDLEEELGRRVDIAEESTLHPLIRDRVLHEAIPL